MTQRINLGDYNTLTIVKQVDFGLYLDGGDEGEILLPNRYVPEGAKIGDQIEVFIYLDNEERLVATTEHPLCKVGDFAWLEVAWVNQYGAFLKWGPMKDLFCPFREQKKRMEQGEHYIVHVHIDEESYRIVASAKVERYMEKEPHDLTVGQEVQLLVQQKTELGFKVIIDNRFGGLVYDDQVFRPLHTGDQVKGYIATLRPDGKIDVTLQPTGRKAVLGFSDVLLQYLQSHDGYCELGDKSDAELIKERFQVSKKVYKQAIGDLYRQRIIAISPDGIRLVMED